MTSRERVSRMFEHREADRIPITDEPWAGTLRRWTAEGMPAGADWRDYLSIDKIRRFGVDVSPRYQKETLEETDGYIVYKTEYGVTLKQQKLEDSTPEFLDYRVSDPARWAEAKKRMVPSSDRVDWAGLERDLALWRAEGSWIQALFWFGFDVTHSWMTGFEPMLVAMIEDPGWVADMVAHMLDMNIALYDEVWDKGHRFDSIFWYDDMGYKGTQFFSLAAYRELLKGAHKRAVDWAHGKGIKAHLHSCGMIEPFVPELAEMGLDALNPLEVKAGMDPLKLKREFGEKLVLHGGINAVLWNEPDAIRAELERVIPALKENGGYIFSSDHSVPNTVSLDDMRGVISLVKRLGRY